MKNLKHFIFAAVLGSSAVASANAFNINEHDAKSTGRGGASAASDTDPSAIVFNPGGIAVAEGTNFAVAGTLYMANGTYKPAGGGDKVETDSNPQFVPSVYLTSRVHEKVAVGIGLHFPFGLSLSWPTGHPQAEEIQDQTLRTYFITPSVGINLDKEVPGLSLGGGVDVVPATVELSRAVVFGDTTGSAHLGGDALGIGGRLGAMYRSPKAPLKLGVMWRSDVKLDFSGNGDFDIAEPYRSQLPPDGKITTTITLPQQIWGGVAFDPTPELEVELDAVWINWDKFKDLTINLPGDVTTSSPENYKNTVTYRAGVEYALKPQKAAVRAGFIYDPSPIPTTTLTAQLPDIDRKILTVGGSKFFGEYAGHFGILWVLPGERDTSSVMYMPAYKGTYGVSAIVFSLQLSGHFGASSPPPKPVAE